MADLKIQGEVSLDATGADQAFARVDAGAKQMAQNVAAAGKQAAAGMASVGAGAEDVARRTTAAASGIAASIRRSTSEQQRMMVEAQGYAKGSAEAIEALARRRGVDTAAMQGQLGALRQLRSENEALAATQREASAATLFERQHQAARELVRSSEYVRMWTDALDKKDAAERRTAGQEAFLASLREQSAAIGKTRADLLEMKAVQMGLGTQAAPMIAQLRASEKQVTSMGMSAAATAAAMRNVPAQFTDIVVSLQGGMNPMTVFLQQGGQLKDMFGGMGPAARALGGYIRGLINPFTLAAAGAGVLALAYFQGSKEADAYRKAMVTTGNASGTTGAQLQNFAREISGVAGTQRAAAGALAEMAATGKVSNTILKESAQAALQYSRVTGQATADTAKQFASLATEPLAAVLKLNDGMNFLTESAYRQIKSLQEQGRTTDAARVAQVAYAAALTSRAAEIQSNLGAIEGAWKRIKDAASGAWDTMLNIGRTSTAGDQLEKARADLEARVQRGPLNEQSRGAWEKGNAALREQIAMLGEQERVTRRSAEADAQRAANQRLFYDWEKQGEAFKSQSAKRDEEVRKAEVEGRALVAAGLLKESELRERITGIQKKYEDKGSGAGAKREQSAYAQLVASIQQKIAQNEEELRWSGRLTEADSLRIKLVAELQAGAKTLTAAHKAEAMALLEKLDAQDRANRNIKTSIALYLQQQEAAEEAARAASASDAGRRQGVQAVVDYGTRSTDDLAGARFELSLMGATEQARARAIAQRRVQLELEKELDRIANNADMSSMDKTWARQAAQLAAANTAAAEGAKLAIDQLKELDAYLDPARAQDFGSALRDAFGEAGNALAQLTNGLQGYAQQQAEIAKMQEALHDSKGQISQADFYKREQALARKSAQAQVGTYAAIAGAAKGFFKEHSKGYNAMAAVEKGFRLMEMGMAVQSLTKQLFGVNAVTAATVAGEQVKAAAVVAGTGMQVSADLVKGTSAAAVGVATQAQGDPYSAFARMAAMAAVMATLGFAVSGGGGSSSSAVREKRQATQGTGTVFGDSDAKSNSLGNAFDMLEDSAKIELRYQSGMLASLRNIENSMAGVANAVLRTAGITSGNATGVIEGVLSTNKGDPIMNAIGLGPLSSMASNLPLIGGVIGKLQSLWGKTKQEIVDSGLTIGGAVSALMGGEGFGSYTDIKKTKSSFFGLSKSTSYRTQFGELDEGTEDALARVFRNLSSTLVLASGAFGRDAEQVGQQIAATVIDIPRVSLRDLKGEDLQEAITSTISAAADTIGKTVTPGLDDFQRVGEGYFETIIRVSAGIESADYALERFGIGAVGFQEILAKQGDVAAEIFRDSVARFEGAGKGITQIMQGVAGSVDDLADTYRDLIAVRNALKSVGANGSDPSFDLLRGAGGVEALQDGLDVYLEGFFSETERYTSASARLSEQFAQIGIAQPQDIASFRALANSLDLTDAASAALFGRLMNVAEAFYDVASAVEASERNLKEAFDDVAADWFGADDLRAYRATRISEGLGDVGLSISPEQILGASAEQFKDMFYAIDRTTMAGRKQATALLEVWGAFQEMNKAAEEAKTAWQGLADSIVDEIKRIRGEMAGSETQGIAQAQAEFAIATAKARAGDESAAGDLPTLSRAVLDLAKKTASSATELKLFQGQIAASLAETTKQIAASQGVTVPAFASGGTHAGGWALVGERGPELVNLPPSRIFSASQSAGMMGNVSELVAEVRALREENRDIAGQLARVQMRIAKASESTARVLDEVTEGGSSMRTAEVAP